MAAGRSGSTTTGVRVPSIPARISPMMAWGSSVRGLSEVTTTRSAREAAMDPIRGRLLRSRSPPQPKRQITLRSVRSRTVVRMFSRASGVWA